MFNHNFSGRLRRPRPASAGLLRSVGLRPTPAVSGEHPSVQWESAMTDCSFLWGRASRRLYGDRRQPMAKAVAAKGGTRPLSRVGDADLVERRRAQIVEAATRLVARQGFAKTVVRDIAEEANISVGLVYEYVRSKEDILFLIYEHWSRVWGEGLEKAISRGKDPLDQLMSAVSFLVG